MENLSSRLLTSIYLALVFYCIGAIMIENEVNYRTWLLVGAEEFPAFHTTFDELLFPFFKLPLALCLFFSFLLMAIKPPRKYLLIYIVNFAVLTYFLGISLWLQVPIHEQLNEQHSTGQILKLIDNNRLYRSPAVVLMLVSNFYLLYVSIDRRNSTTV
ncbi:hypothetical protein [Negadavirga shengliensis]|uniref:Uncharacterized protein n=1 Tax=Negadavirga shengliensis TaxID=1389218 RepID=A0ABV9T6R9_9BACT